MNDAIDTSRGPRAHVRRVALSLIAFAGLVAGATGVIILLVSAVTQLAHRGP